MIKGFLQTEVGILIVEGDTEVVKRIYWGKEIGDSIVLEGEVEKAIQELAEYLLGERTEFTFKIDLQGTDFQKRVWQETMKIPYGQTVNYADIAKKLNMTKGFQAIGRALKNNNLVIYIPCHRVVHKDNKLSGYNGGIEKKDFLLTLEKNGG